MKKKFKRKRGNLILQIVAISLYFFLYIACMFVFTRYKINAESEMVSDALIASNLAVFSTKNLNLQLISDDPNSNTVLIKDSVTALSTFKRHLKYNLGLDDNLKPLEDVNFIKSNVKIDKFIIYNVNGNDVIVNELNSLGNFTTKTFINGRNMITTPKGSKIEATTIHSQISFKINHLFNNDMIVNPSEDADIIKE